MENNFLEKRIYSNQLDLDVQTRPRFSKNGGIIYRSNDGGYIKVYSSSKDFITKVRKDLVEKLLFPTEIKGVSKPDKLVYVHDNFIGFTMNKIDGVNDIEYEETMNMDVKDNIHRLAQKYIELEKLVKEASDDIVFPCLLDREDMIVDKKGKINFINYDNIQVGKQKSLDVSDKLGEAIMYYDKYRENGLYTKQLDIRSLVIYYYQIMFGVDIVNDTLDLEKLIGGDKELARKTRLIFDDTDENEYIGEDVLRIADSYELKTDLGTKKLLLK